MAYFLIQSASPCSLGWYVFKLFAFTDLKSDFKNHFVIVLDKVVVKSSEYKSKIKVKDKNHYKEAIETSPVRTFDLGVDLQGRDRACLSTTNQQPCRWQPHPHPQHTAPHTPHTPHQPTTCTL